MKRYNIATHLSYAKLISITLLKGKGSQKHIHRVPIVSTPECASEHVANMQLLLSLTAQRFSFDTTR